ncbi:MAG: CotH kinase family protein [Candidatus Sabulitectum sp.]|nr:CotH kinase family protein [Candidatus Sabulitectum sp.]
MKCFSRLLVLVLPALSPGDFTPQEHPLFVGDEVQEIRLYFYEDNFWSLLEDNYQDKIYLQAEFQWEDVSFDTVGVRFKGGSSFTGNPTMKKSFKIDFNEFVDNQDFLGLRKINLNCNFHDPSFVREICAYELCAEAGLPAVRTTFAALYINDIYWGLYTVIEQFDGQFVEDHFGPEEDGNLWKGDNHGSLEYLGESQEAYFTEYELKTNEEENDWSGLIELTYGLNNTASEFLPDSLSNLMDVNTALALLAVDNLLVNLDSYAGRCANYYLYHKDLDDRFVFSNWDMNESWGVFDFWNHSIEELQSLDIYWVSPAPGESRPLAVNLWSVDEYQQVYEGHILRLMSGGADPDALVSRMEELRDIIRDWVYLEVPPRSMFSPEQFEAAMDQNIPTGPGGFIPALETFIRNRDAYLTNLLGSWEPVEGLVLNELMAKNDTTIADAFDEYNDWLEVANCGSESINLSSFYLTDDMAFPHKYAFPDTVIESGEYFVIWTDSDEEQGSMHTCFKLDSDGEEVYLLQSWIIVDQITFPALGTDISYGRSPDSTGEWQILSNSSPGSGNHTGNGSSFQIENGSEAGTLAIFVPNPVYAGSIVEIQGGNGLVQFAVYDLTGRAVAEPLVEHMEFSLSLEWDSASLPAGVYIMRLSQNGNSVCRRVTLIR